MTLGIQVVWEIFHDFGNSPIAMRSLKKLDNNSDTMQLAIFKNLDVMSLGELFDFVLRFSMRRWISYASVGARNNEFFVFIFLRKCLQVTRGGIIFAETDFRTSEKKLFNSSHLLAF